MERFWSKVEKTEDCWYWIGSRSKSGYGSFGLNRKVLRAHRVAFSLTFGPIPDGAHILHSCDNPPCVRPDHLRIGTRSENMQDKIRRGRDFQASKTRCLSGHEFDAVNTYVTPNGRRNCRTCRRQARRAYLSRLAERRSLA